jgi:hypothetical protein
MSRVFEVERALPDTIVRLALTVFAVNVGIPSFSSVPGVHDSANKEKIDPLIETPSKLDFPHSGHSIIHLLFFLNQTLPLMPYHVTELIQHIVLDFPIAQDYSFGDVVCGIDFDEKVINFGQI